MWFYADVEEFEMTVILLADIWSYLHWVGVLFLGFCRFLGECGDYVLPSKKFLWDPDRCGHGVLSKICFSVLGADT